MSNVPVREDVRSIADLSEPNGAGRTSRRIEQAAVDLFFERGFVATTMREIALRCELTAGALYNHFASKDQILVSIIDRVHDELERVLVEALDGAGDDPREQLAALVRAHALIHTRFREEARVANQEIPHLPEADRARIIEARDRMRRMFEDVLERGARVGLFDLPDRLVATMAILNMGIRIAEWVRPGGRLTPEQIASMHADLALRMVSRR